MTQPVTPTPDQILDQAIINAGRELVTLHLEDADTQRIEAARAKLIGARQKRYPNA